MFDAANIEPVYQPIFDLRDGSVVGYEALARGRGGNGLASPEALFAAAREQGRVAELDRACREAALAGAVEGGLGAPFCLFVNADAGALEDDLPGTPRAGFTLVMEVTERALTERPGAAAARAHRAAPAAAGASRSTTSAPTRARSR